MQRSSYSNRYLAHPRRPFAFTLVELLVVIAIIGILIALLLPAVQAAREAAHRTQCSDNLKNMGLGCQAYASAKRALPPGKLVDDNSCTNDPTEYSNWAIEILPFVEEAPLYQRYHFDQTNDNAVNLPVLQTVLKIQSCPSDPNPPALLTPEKGPAGPFASSSYKGVSGTGWYPSSGVDESYPDSGKTPTGGLRVTDRGALSTQVRKRNNCPIDMWSAPVKLTQITDGTSKTLLIGEYTTVSAPSAVGSRSAFWGNSYFGMDLACITLPQACQANPLKCSSTAVNGIDYSIQLDPDFVKCTTAMTTAGSPQACRRAFAGVHGGGYISFVFCDGSVRGFISTIDIRVLAALSTVAGGENVSVP